MQTHMGSHHIVLACASAHLSALIAVLQRLCVYSQTLDLQLCRLAKKLVYGKIRAALGVSKCVVSGGGSLQPHLDEFYEVLDLTVLNGWGLSEVRCSLTPSAKRSV